MGHEKAAGRSSRRERQESLAPVGANRKGQAFDPPKGADRKGLEGATVEQQQCLAPKESDMKGGKGHEGATGGGIRKIQPVREPTGRVKAFGP